MKKEDIEFLSKLKEEMNNGDKVCQAFPRFWMIMDYKLIPTHEGYEDDIYYLDMQGDWDTFTFEEMKQDIIENWDEDDENYADVISEIQCASDYDDLEYRLEKYNYKLSKNWEPMPMRQISYYTDFSGAFLTKESCEEHLKANKHYYSKDAHPYALTAFRNPRFEKLMKIITETNWEEMLKNV